MSQTTLDKKPPLSGGAPEADSRRWWVLVIVSIAQLMVVLDATIVTVALPDAQKALDMSDANKQWVVTAYALAFGALLLLGGRIADFWGRKKAFVTGMIGFAAASAIGGAAQNEAMLFGSRALQGVFAALLAPAALAVLTVTFTEGKERAKAFAVYGGISAGGAAIGLLLGGVLTQYATWRWCLLVNVPIAVIAILAAMPMVKESRAQGDTRYDIPGAIAVTLGLAALVYGFTRAAEEGWSDGLTVAMLVAGVLLLIVFVFIEKRTEHALLPLRIVADRNRGGSLLVMLLVGAAFIGSTLFMIYYMRGVLHYGAVKAGAGALGITVGVFITAGASAALLPKIGPRVPLFTGAVLAAVGTFWLTFVTVEPQYATHVLPGMVIIGLGLGLVFTSVASTALIGIEERDAGAASASINAVQQVGGALGTALLNSFATTAIADYMADKKAQLGPALADPAVLQNTVAHAQLDGYTTAFAWASAIMVVGAVVSAIFVNAGKDALPSGGGPAVHVG
ncbi:MFS transporter [Yinghuangia seranimata]|uniref:MFS transporter n=1 Tax=Yinghuangia seranimata TaxID=408067 RepID=UPI00248C0997|nr:MFS transporter [Yinghuangia seranimata]MDI2127256.1 MFS transporter [Yinghuangia seranimata]MDI2132201.1 MFS transporter [Yinghuangia seranimata]